MALVGEPRHPDWIRRGCKRWGKEAPLSYYPCSSINREKKERKRKKKEGKKKNKDRKKNSSLKQGPKGQKELDGYWEMYL